jgi:hypothetical protein
MTPQDELDPRLEAWLNELKDVPARDPQAANRARSRFLAQAVSAQQAVSPRPQQRLTWWNYLTQKERFAMNLLISLLLVVGTLFGGGVTVYAAQDDLPNQTLYPVKLLTEDVRLSLTSDTNTQVQLLLDQAQTRVDEMTALAAQGVTPPESVSLRLQEELDQALQLSANMDDPGLTTAIQQINERLQMAVQTLARVETQVNPHAQPVIARTRAMIEARLQLVTQGLGNLQEFRNNVRNHGRFGQTETPSPMQTVTPGTMQPGHPGNGQGNQGNGQGHQPSMTPGSGYGPGNPMQTPMPGGQGGQGGHQP